MGYEYGERARNSGALGEALILELFGLREPEVEIKTFHAKEYSVPLTLCQLEKAAGKRYLFVIYDRGARKQHPKTKKRHYEKSVQRAMQTANIYSISGTDLLQLVLEEVNEEGASGLAFLKHESQAKGRFVVYLSKLRITNHATNNCLFTGSHCCYDCNDLIQAVEDLPI